ncbi:YbaB/EbfC family DNA-binding protein [Nocardia otitidiscaviarum]|uniref:YbaB/EbfC family DNA-binding protein n=1 Tax=Nocardia otitidiscaviarum TaxID=1823 RepID=A0A378YHG5_9NOCA|nr:MULTISPECIES: hypothetical protein [Nocardia]MBF6133823.1 YbaB/EbfC family DNA-binding protein [Nocardia otitidiscaviarum]MBF6179614.1 YbaB/EbfC family DNA-binding protein [Nocardia otitidiscaviarum]MBF6235793.1 YbaB/EbfC family DNA-binding protein [Nocardia otitidiscaviarum]MBF6487851.1 YbaB/EbfC family DNA-binding protein [Nocardia otitidiscaviarum]MCP9621024.1 YbaB/EbfC family DNA-binding protein [Nocardia otitidiscaviarum]
MIESMDELQARVNGQLNRLLDLQDAMVAVRMRETSPDGAITVEVDGNGGLVDLELGTPVSRMSPEEFERVLVDTCATAAGRVFAERSRLVVDFNDEMATGK